VSTTEQRRTRTITVLFSARSQPFNIWSYVSCRVTWGGDALATLDQKKENVACVCLRAGKTYTAYGFVVLEVVSNSINKRL